MALTEDNKISDLAVKEYFPCKLMNTLLNGEWPELKGTDYEGFSFQEASFVIEDGLIHPCDQCGDLVDGPSFELKVITGDE